MLKTINTIGIIKETKRLNPEFSATGVVIKML